MTELKRPEIDTFEVWFMELYDDDTTPFCTYHSLEEVSNNDYAGDGFSSKELADLLRRCWNTAQIVEKRKVGFFLSQIAEKLEEARRLKNRAIQLDAGAMNDFKEFFDLGITSHRKSELIKSISYCFDESLAAKENADAIEDEVIQLLKGDATAQT